jgi:hypothetical protein
MTREVPSATSDILAFMKGSTDFMKGITEIVHERIMERSTVQDREFMKGSTDIVHERCPCRNK